MAPVSSTSDSQATTQFVWQQLKLQQAVRNADQAEQTARALRAQADSAQERAYSLAAQSSQAENNAVQARRGLAAIRSLGVMQAQLEGAVTRVAQAMEKPGAPAIPPQTQAGTTTDGQVAGTVVNVTA